MDRDYRDKGLKILGFPCRQFANQEYSNSADIIKFIAQYSVEFDMFETVNVNGPAAHPIYMFLKYHSAELGSKSASGAVSSIGWNFGKFLVDRQGRVVKYYGPRTAPKSITEDLEKVLSGELQGQLRHQSL
eukprot:GHVQ01041538.1.p1 GENE.GHVQ01041538.1~~GHVQ01041538.1.p1  ORF type:complete len:131 (-),score=15.96 GHVQ01041538.1:185-577(-)